MSTAASTSTSIPYTISLPGGIPATHRPHTENTTTILVPNANVAFLNPVQQYNRDMSVAVIRAWNEMRKEEAEARWKRKQERVEARPELKQKKQDRVRRKREAKMAGAAGTENGTVEEDGAESTAGGGSALGVAVSEDDPEAKSTAPVAGPSNPVWFHVVSRTSVAAAHEM